VVLEGSVLGMLLDLPQYLRERFPCWERRGAPPFVLMGRAPVVGLPNTIIIIHFVFRPNLVCIRPSPSKHHLGIR
jgi:hypothetical protein